MEAHSEEDLHPLVQRAAAHARHGRGRPHERAQRRTQADRTARGTLREEVQKVQQETTHPCPEGRELDDGTGIPKGRESETCEYRYEEIQYKGRGAASLLRGGGE